MDTDMGTLETIFSRLPPVTSVFREVERSYSRVRAFPKLLLEPQVSEGKTTTYLA
jgi:hypothetical protein